MKKGGKTEAGNRTVAGPVQQLLARLEAFVRSEINMLELDAVDGCLTVADRDQAGRVFKALLNVAEEAGMLADNGRVDTWAAMFRRYYLFMDSLEVKDVPVEVIAGNPSRKVRATWCQCGNVKDGPMLEDGACTCGIHKHHVHCLHCGGVTQVG